MPITEDDTSDDDDSSKMTVAERRLMYERGLLSQSQVLISAGFLRL